AALLLPAPAPTQLSTLSLHDALPILLHDAGADPARLVALKAELIGQGRRVRLERAPRNLKALLDSLAASGYRHFAHVGHAASARSEEHTSELQSRENLVCRLLLEKKK